ncbi:hypothetical protein HN011_009030 [Eciton burchellii]|nr:hypothetical protein HN011_009030 [Eciton burchellii]
MRTKRKTQPEMRSETVSRTVSPALREPGRSRHGDAKAIEQPREVLLAGTPDRSITRVGVSKQEFPTSPSGECATRRSREGPNFPKKKKNE